MKVGVCTHDTVGRYHTPPGRVEHSLVGFCEAKGSSNVTT